MTQPDVICNECGDDMAAEDLTECIDCLEVGCSA